MSFSRGLRSPLDLKAAAESIMWLEIPVIVWLLQGLCHSCCEMMGW